MESAQDRCTCSWPMNVKIINQRRCCGLLAGVSEGNLSTPSLELAPLRRRHDRRRGQRAFTLKELKTDPTKNHDQ